MRPITAASAKMMPMLRAQSQVYRHAERHDPPTSRPASGTTDSRMPNETTTLPQYGN